MGSAVALADGVWRVPTAPADLLNSYLLREPDGGFTLVDAGLRRAHKPILAALAGLGAGPDSVRTILLTHAHNDHTGGLAEVVRRTAAPVSAHTDDAGWVESGVVPPRDRSTWLGRVGNRRPARFEPVPVTTRFADGEMLDVAGGLRVWHTPGHTPGHVSLRHEPTGVLLTGDAVFNVRGLRWPPRGFCTDAALGRRSADVLGEIDYEVAAFNHGAEIRVGARDAVRAFLRGRPR